MTLPLATLCELSIVSSALGREPPVAYGWKADISSSTTQTCSER